MRVGDWHPGMGETTLCMHTRTRGPLTALPVPIELETRDKKPTRQCFGSAEDF